MLGREYEVYKCQLYNDIFGITFSTTDKKSSKTLAVHLAEEDLVIHIPNAKGVVPWSSVSAFVYRAKDARVGSFRVEFVRPVYLVGEIGRSKVDFGTLTRECWEELVSLVDSNLQMTYVPVQ